MADSNATAEPGRSLPWRGPEGSRPDLPIPPRHQPLLQKGQIRKRWRYVGFYGEEVMLCAAVVKIGPFSHTFWSVWDRGTDATEGQVFEHTRLRPGTPEVVLDGPQVEIRSREVKASLRFGDADPIEVVSSSGRAWGWTRKRAGVPVTGRIEIPGRSFDVDGFGVDDESAGYHARHTAWFWSAGIGTSSEGQALGWNLVEGINDSPTNSERAIWVDGKPYEPGPVSFKGLDSVVFGEAGTDTAASVLKFDFEGAERRRRDNFGLIRSTYIHRFGTFSGSLDSIELTQASGVMEEHDVRW